MRGNWQTDSFPETSVAVQATGVVPRENKPPEGGTQTTTGEAVAARAAAAEPGPEAHEQATGDHPRPGSGRLVRERRREPPRKQ